jgi:hypothetical protein
MKTLLSRKFEALFKPEIESQGLKLPGRWAHLGTLSLESLLAQDGWLALEWSVPGNPQQVARVE